MIRMLFETTVSGHHLEYIHHLYMGMLSHPEDEYVIVVPKAFEEKKGLYKWPEAPHVRFRYLTEDVEETVGVMGIGQSFRQTKILRKYVKQEKVDSIFLISLIEYIPALPFLIPGRVKVSGIIYSIYLYLWDSSSWKRRLQDIGKYLLMRFTPCVKTVFILNDQNAAARLNRLYHTHRFKYIPDPYNAVDYTPHSVRKDLGAPDGDRVFLHFGGMAERKGTLDILDAIALLPVEQLKSCAFVFAGRVNEGVKETFYRKKESLPAEARVLVFDEFCTNEFLADLCVSCDFILAPYHITNCSSGLLGYAAHFGIPVIGPSDGLVGDLIRRYRLGVTLREVTAESIREEICKAVPYRLESDYKEVIKVERFIDTVFENRRKDFNESR